MRLPNILVLLVLSLSLVGLVASVHASGKSKCSPRAVDLTDQQTRLMVQDAIPVRVSQPIEYVTYDGTKVSSVEVLLSDGAGNTFGNAISCAGSCAGDGCVVDGCKASADGCSGCTCTSGVDCSQCTCTKTEIYFPSE